MEEVNRGDPSDRFLYVALCFIKWMKIFCQNSFINRGAITVIIHCWVLVALVFNIKSIKTLGLCIENTQVLWSFWPTHIDRLGGSPLLDELAGDKQMLTILL